jgi:hypothetical protein
MRLPVALFAFALAAFAAEEPNLLKNGSFEEPAAKGRVAATAGGSPGQAGEGKTTWTHCEVTPAKDATGALVLGLTDQTARTGKQAFFVDFQKLGGGVTRSVLMTDLFPVKEGETYRIALWGRTDPKRPLTLDQRRAVMKVEIEFFAEDMETQTGDNQYRAEVLPGSKDRRLFNSSRWNEYFTRVRTPDFTKYMKVTFRFETGRDAGVIDGGIYFDDAAVVFQPGQGTLVPRDPNAKLPAEDEEMEEKAAGEPAEAAPAPPPAKQP